MKIISRATTKLIIITFILLANLVLIPFPWFDAYATLMMAGPSESARLRRTGNISVPELIEWSEVKTNKDRDTFECYTPYLSTSDAAVTYQIGTARKLFSTLTIYKIVNCEKCNLTENCIASGPRALITFNIPMIVFANLCTTTASIGALYLTIRGINRRA